jgi:hypothetical protein
VPVHDVDVEQLCSAFLAVAQGKAEVAEVSGQDRRSDLHRLRVIW